MAKPVPSWVAKRYGGARGFRAARRRNLRLLAAAYRELRCGSAYFPGDGYDAIRHIGDAIDTLKRELGREAWGQ